MKKKIVGIFVCTLMLVATGLPVAGTIKSDSFTAEEKFGQADDHYGNFNLGSRDGWTLQWTHAYGGNGHSQHTQPIGDIDEDGVNEVILGGYETTGTCRILSYDVGPGTYVEEYSWYVPGGSYHSPSGSSVIDLNEDGNLEFCVSWTYSGADGVYAYDWDGTTLTQLDWYHGTGVDFVFDIYSCDYDDDGHLEVLIANAPNMGTGPYHVTALGWDIANNLFIAEAYWTSPGNTDKECPMVWSGDTDNDHKTEVIATISNDASTTAGTWALNWNEDTEEWVGEPVWTDYPGKTVYGVGVGDIDGDETPEIGIGSYGGTPTGWLYEWDGTGYEEVWYGEYPAGQPVIEAVSIGDADNDGENEFCVGAEDVHIIQWNGANYIEEATLTEPTGMLSGVVIGDCDTDGRNELKACEILSGTGSEFIWKFTDTTPPVTICTLEGEMNESIYISNVTVTLTATDVESGVNYTTYKLDSDPWLIYTAPFVVSKEGTHTVYFYSVDNFGNVEQTKNSTFTIRFPSYVEIKMVKGGIGVSVVIKNNGSTDLLKVPWSIKLDGGFIMKGKLKNGTILKLDAGQERTLKSSVFGIGKTKIMVTAGTTEKNATGFVLLFFVLGVK